MPIKTKLYLAAAGVILLLSANVLVDWFVMEKFHQFTEQVTILEATGEMATAAFLKLQNVQEQAKRLSITISLLALFLGAGLMLAILRTITCPVETAMQSEQTMAEGDFSTRSHGRAQDEARSSVEAFNRSLAKASEQARWYESILDAIPHAISATDIEMRRTFLNKTARDILNDNDPLAGQPCIMATDCFHMTDSQGICIGHVTVVRDVTEDELRRMEAEAASVSDRKVLQQDVSVA